MSTPKVNLSPEDAIQLKKHFIDAIYSGHGHPIKNIRQTSVVARGLSETALRYAFIDACEEVCEQYGFQERPELFRTVLIAKLFHYTEQMEVNGKYKEAADMCTKMLKIAGIMMSENVNQTEFFAQYGE